MATSNVKLFKFNNLKLTIFTVQSPEKRQICYFSKKTFPTYSANAQIVADTTIVARITGQNEDMERDFCWVHIRLQLLIGPL
ncbi:hypothetical protein ACTXT7_016568, partial [Hymenolepis weldensis]